MSKKELEDWILHMGAELNRLSQELTPAGPKLARQKEWAPRVDVIESPEHVTVTVELAGVRSNQFVIQYSGDDHTVTVRGERRDETVQDRPTAPHQLEIEFGPFARTVRLPEVALDMSRAQAKLCSGMLVIVVPKKSTQDDPGYVIERTITVRRLR